MGTTRDSSDPPTPWLPCLPADSPEVNLLEHFEAIVAFLRRVEEVNGRALVHCVAGSSRSATAIIMHLMSSHDLYLADAYQTVRSVRPQTNPNSGFKYQLAELEVGSLTDWEGAGLGAEI